MSTFKGVVKEFPDIRIDYFRKIHGRDNPLACFLSHVHSDHLQGLESLHAPFIYCSPATRELLLRLEKYPHRMNFHRGILESRKQHYKHLKTLIKTIPMNTPTEIELKLGNSIRVTLLDANHCVGAVMFLIENDTIAVLYTGDIRSEPWWVNSLIRNPVVLPYTHGLKRLDKIYLDTTFASKKNNCRKFPTKGDGLEELLKKVSKYSTDTVFHFDAWTFGYEDVWIALSRALDSQIHVDEYKYSLYESLGTTAKSRNPSPPEGSALSGFWYGNKFQDGCLTPKQNVRLHSCQHDMSCSVLEASNIVYIRPIVSRSAEGLILPEVGAGGGGGDLNQVHELELDDPAAVAKLIELCTKEITDQEISSNAINRIIKAKKTQKMVVSLDTAELDGIHETIPLAKLAKLLARFVLRNGKISQIDGRAESSCRGMGGGKTPEKDPVMQELPRCIEFPYSRHSSYEELCDLVKAFEPVDVYPCSIDQEYINLSVSIESLFGHLCVGSTYAHDEDMKTLANQREPLNRRMDDCTSQIVTSSREEDVDQRDTSPVSLLGSASDSEPHALDDLERVPKRPRTSPSFLGNSQGDLEMRRSEGLSPKRKLPEFKQSFKSYLRQSKREKILPIPKSSDLRSNHVANDTGTSRTAMSGHQGSSAALHSDSDRNVDTLQNAHLVNGSVDIHRGTQAAPIELSDGDPSSQGNEAGTFLLEEMPEPEDIPNALNESQLDRETQITLSDAAFESQSSHSSNPDIKAMKLQKRKEAYRAAKEPSGIWGLDHGLISSDAHHGEEELEL